MVNFYANVGLLATPTEENHLVNKAYVDTVIRQKNDRGIFGHSAAGAVLSLEPTTDFPLSKFEIFGRSEQQKTTGAQLFDGKMRQGSSDNKNVMIRCASITPIPCKIGDTMTVHCDGLDVLVGTQTDTTEVFTYAEHSEYINETATWTSTINGYFRFNLRYPDESTITPFDLESKKIMANYGTTSLQYEPYTGGIPAPSPDNPMLINVPGNIIKGNNLIDCANVDVSAESKYVRFEIPNDSYTYSIQISKSRIPDITIENVNVWMIKEGHAYDSEDNLLCNITLSDSIAKIEEIVSGVTKVDTGTFIVPKGTKYVRLLISNFNSDTNVNICVDYCMVNVGTTILPYEPYPSAGNIEKYNVIEVEGAGKNLSLIESGDSAFKVCKVTKGYQYTFSATGLYGDVYSNIFIDTEKIGEMKSSTKRFSFTFTAPATGMLVVGSWSSEIYNEIQVELGDRATDYSTYKKYTSTLHIPGGLPGILLPDDATEYTYIDENGQKWITDTIEYDGERAKYVKRIGHIRLDGKQNYITRWGEDQGVVNGTIYAFSLEEGNAAENCLALSDRLMLYNNLWGLNKDGFYFSYTNDQGIYIRIKLTNDTIGEQSIQDYFANHPTEFYYVLVAPITTYTDALTLESLRRLHTFDGETVFINSGECKMNMEYTVDNRTEVEKRLYMRDDETGEKYQLKIKDGKISLEKLV